MNESEITQLLAFWGALTGTVGTIAGLLNLYIRHRQHQQDKARLSAESIFKFHFAPHHDHEIVIKSLGRRPVTLERIRYFVIPNNFFDRLTRKRLHKKNKWIWDQKFDRKPTLNEGRKEEVRPKLPDGLNFDQIYKAIVIDDIGREWPIKWPSIAYLKKHALCEELNSESEKEKGREVSLQGYKAGVNYFLSTQFRRTPQPSGVPCGKNYRFSTEREYRDKVKHIKDIEFSRFLSGEIDGWE